MTEHPLTEEMMDKIHGDEPGNLYPYDDCSYDEDDMRAAYDKGRDDTLDKVCDWISDNLEDPRLLDDIYLVVLDDVLYNEDDDLLVAINTDSIVDNLYIAIHPQENN